MPRDEAHGWFIQTGVRGGSGEDHGTPASRLLRRKDASPRVRLRGRGGKRVLYSNVLFGEATADGPAVRPYRLGLGRASGVQR